MKDPQLEAIVDDFKNRQQNLRGDHLLKPFPPDPLHLTDKSQPGATIALAIVFLLLAVFLFVTPFLKDFEGASILCWLIALGPLLLSISMFRSLRKHGSKPPESR